MFSFELAPPGVVTNDLIVELSGYAELIGIGRRRGYETYWRDQPVDFARGDLGPGAGFPEPADRIRASQGDPQCSTSAGVAQPHDWPPP